MDWVSINESQPKEIGWYKIKTPYGEFEAAFVNNIKRKKVWVIPDPSIITHWALISKAPARSGEGL